MGTLQVQDSTSIEEAIERAEQVQLQKLSPRHRQVAALLAQGVDRVTIANAVEYTPEYVTWLQRQPLFIAYVKEMSVAVGTQLEALFGRSVEVIREQMENGKPEDALRAAKLQLEATGRVGRFQTPLKDNEGGDRLENLADRLLGLLDRKRKTVNGEVVDGEVVSRSEG